MYICSFRVSGLDPPVRVQDYVKGGLFWYDIKHGLFWYNTKHDLCSFLWHKERSKKNRGSFLLPPAVPFWVHLLA